MATNGSQQLSEIRRYITEVCKKDHVSLEEFFGRIVRQGLDEVIDGPRTGRCSLDELSPPEQAYVGTKIEIIVRAELEVARGNRTDAEIAGHEVEIKWSRSLQWMIGPENLGKFCLGLGASDHMRKLSVGLFKADASLMNAGENRDHKKTLSAEGRSTVDWLVRDAPLTPNFVSTLTQRERETIFGEPSAQARVAKLVQIRPRVPIPRDAFRTVALDKADPMRRLRRDKHRDNPLGGMAVLSTKYGRKELLRAGIKESDLLAEHWIAIPEADLVRHRGSKVSSGSTDIEESAE